MLHYDSVLARTLFQHTAARRRLTAAFRCRAAGRSFNTQPPEGGWVSDVHFVPLSQVSTHSRPKAAVGTLKSIVGFSVFQHTAARRRLHHQRPDPSPGGRFNTQPPEGGCISKYALKGAENVSTHSRPKAAGVKKSPRNSVVWFQHTAARRRLPQQHPRAGAIHRFNTQPPEGGWTFYVIDDSKTMFQHTAARRRLVPF